MGLLKVLPPPPAGKTGWPWTKESSTSPYENDSSRGWPKISIVTPSFNQGEFIEETIRSVLLQNYPNIEYVVIDGGSDDNSIDIINKYKPWLSSFVSEEDRGQSHAINKGFKKCTGEILNWLCSDDILLPRALEKISSEIELEKPAWLVGGALRLDERSRKATKAPIPKSIDIETFLFWRSRGIAQPSIYWNRKIFGTNGMVREDLSYCMDVDLWFKFYKTKKPLILGDYLSSRRIHDAAKTTPYSGSYDKFTRELVIWMLENLYCAEERGLREEVICGIVVMQKELGILKRLKNHIVLGKLIALWKNIINSNLLT
jgi:glycosyltransferase involved in cell wall biosynthesis